MTVPSETAPPGLSWRPRSFVFLGAAAALLAAAVVLRNPVPLFLALPLLLAPAAAALSGPRRNPSATLVWSESGSASKVLVLGTVTPDPTVRAGDLVVSVAPPSGLVEEGRASAEIKDGTVEFRLAWRAAEPTLLSLPAPRVVWRDAAGLVERPVEGERTELVIVRYPPELVRLGAVRLDRTTVLPGETRSRRIGESGEFFGIRQADPHDPPRRINWRASARAGRLLANEFALERTGDVVLLVDVRPTELGIAVDERLLGITRAAVEGIAESFLHAKSRVGLGVYGEFLTAVPLSTGRTQRFRIRHELLRARLTEAPGPSERCAVAFRRYFPPGVTTVLFSSLADEASASLVPHLRRRGYPIVVLSPSPLPLLPRPRGLGPENTELAGRLERLVRRAQVAQAWRDGPAIDWEDYGSLGGFVEFLRRPSARRVS